MILPGCFGPAMSAMLITLAIATSWSIPVAARRWLKDYSQMEIAGYSTLPGAVAFAAIALFLWLSGPDDIHAPLNTSTVPTALGNFQSDARPTTD